MKTQQPKNIIITTDNGRSESSTKLNLTLVIITLALVGGGAFFYFKGIKDDKAQGQAALLQSDVPTQQAAIIKNALSGAGTDTEALFNIAPKITNWLGVTQAYKTLTTGGNIEADLNSDLTADEYKYFMSLVGVKGRTSVGSKGLIAPKAVGVLPNKTITLVKQGSAANKGKINFYKSEADYLNGKVLFTADRALLDTVRPVKFISSTEVQWQSIIDPNQNFNAATALMPFGFVVQKFTDKKKDVVFGPKAILYKVQLVNYPGVLKNAIVFLNDYNFVNKGK